MSGSGAAMRDKHGKGSSRPRPESVIMPRTRLLFVPRSALLMFLVASVACSEDIADPTAPLDKKTVPAPRLTPLGTHAGRGRNPFSHRFHARCVERYPWRGTGGAPPSEAPPAVPTTTSTAVATPS